MNEAKHREQEALCRRLAKSIADDALSRRLLDLAEEHKEAAQLLREGANEPHE